jgi:hypothetical protein
MGLTTFEAYVLAVTAVLAVLFAIEWHRAGKTDGFRRRR